MEEKITTYGVIIGRFQTAKLHSEHVKLIQYVINKHAQVILFLGVSPAIGTKRNPLDFITRKLMIEEKFNSLIIMPLSDQKSDTTWSNILDAKIKEIVNTSSVTLYGSKDSFISYYTGNYPATELEPDIFLSATLDREKISKQILQSEEFRAGIIYSVYSQYPTMYSTIDVAIIKENKVLLGQKTGETGWRFIGGFVDPTDENDEQAVKREVLEETSLEIGELKFLGSRKIGDWRYKNTPDRQVMTRFFKAKYIFGSPTPQDDIAKLRWFDLKDSLSTLLVPEHQVLFTYYINDLC